MENKENIKAEDDKEVSYSDRLCNGFSEKKVDFNFKPEKDDDSLYVLLKIIHKKLNPPRAGYLKIKSDNLNRLHVDQQATALAKTVVRTLLEKNIISE